MKTNSITGKWAWMVLFLLVAAVCGCIKIEPVTEDSLSLRTLTHDCSEVYAEFPEMAGTLISVTYEFDTPLDEGAPRQIHYLNTFQKIDIITATVDFEHGFKTDTEILFYCEHLLPVYKNQPFDPASVVLSLKDLGRIVRENGLPSRLPEKVMLLVPTGYQGPQYRYGEFYIDAVTGVITEIKN